MNLKSDTPESFPLSPIFGAGEEDIFNKYILELENRINSEGISGITTGFKEIDHFTNGHQKGTFSIMASVQGMGKSFLLSKFLLNAIESNQNITVAALLLNSAPRYLLDMILSGGARVNIKKILDGCLSEDEQDRIIDATRQIYSFSPRLLVGTKPRYIDDIIKAVKTTHERTELNLLIIDNMSSISGDEVSKKLKSLALDLDIPVFANLALYIDTRPEKKPKIHDISYQTAEFADNIFFLYRDEFYNPESEHAGKAEFIIARSKFDILGSCHLIYQPEYCSFFGIPRE